MELAFSAAGAQHGRTGMVSSAAARRVHAEVALWSYSPDSEHGADPGNVDADAAAQRPRLLLIHGFRGDHHGLQLIVDALPEYEVLVPDLPGFGATPPARSAAGRGAKHTVELYAGFVEGLAAHLGLGSGDVLLGHSFGTTITAAHAAQTQRRWAALVLSAPISNEVFSGPMLPGAAAVELYYQVSRFLPERAGNVLLRSAAALAITNLTMAVDKDPEVSVYVRDQHRRFFGGYTDRATLLQAYRASSRHTVADYAGDLDMPVLLLPGAKDQLSTPAGQRRLRDALPQGHLEIIRGAGHLLHYERPAQLGRAMRRFLRQLSSGAPAHP